jgi:hypothetical protein
MRPVDETREEHKEDPRLRKLKTYNNRVAFLDIGTHLWVYRYINYTMILLPMKGAVG